MRSSIWQFKVILSASAHFARYLNDLNFLDCFHSVSLLCVFVPRFFPHLVKPTV